MAIDASDAALPEAAPPPSARRPAPWWVGALKAAVSLGAVLIVLWAVDIRDAISHAARQSPWPLLLSGGFLLVQLALSALRWHVVRRGLGAAASYWESFRFYYIGSFFSTYVWSAVSGDLMRGWLAYQAGATPTGAANSVLLDRVVLICGLVLIVALSTPWLLMRLHAGPAAAAAPSLLVVGLAGGVIVAGQLHRLPPRWAGFAPVRLAQAMSRGVRDVLLRPTVSAPAIAISIVSQIAMAGAMFALAKSLSIQASLLDCIAVSQIVALASAVPISVGGWGVREVSMVGLLGLLGVPASAALLLSVQLGLVNLAANLPGGLIWLQQRAKVRPKPSTLPEPAP